MTTTQRNRRNLLLSQIEALKEDRRYYYHQIGKFGNSKGDDALLEHIVTSHDNTIRKLNAEFQELEKMRLAEYYQSFEHNFLMSTKGLNGAQVLRQSSRSLDKDDIFLLTSPTLQR